MANSTITEDDVRRARRAYYGNCTYVDEWTGKILDTLKALGLADDTVIIVTADHGDMLGEHGLWYKMNFFEGSARIPLMIHAPQRFRAKRVSSPVSLVDVLPTLTALAGVSETVRRTDGASLIDHCEGTPSTDSTVFGEYLAEGAIAPIVMIRRDNWKYIHSPADPDQLYDLANDPLELHNLAEDPETKSVADSFRAETVLKWDLPALHDKVIESQQARMLITTALRSGQFTSWEWTPPRNASNEYMRNHLDLNDVERLARWPR